jgi:hypothetical protein
MSACPPEAGVIGADPPEAGTVGADPPEEVGAEELLELQDARRVPANIMTKTILIYKVVRLFIDQSTSKFELIEFYLDNPVLTEDDHSVLLNKLTKITPPPTSTSPIICLTEICSPRKMIASKAICGIIRLFRMLDSTAVRVLRVLFQRVKASAVLTTANQMIIPHSYMAGFPKPWTRRPVPSNKIAPMHMLMKVTSKGGMDKSRLA